MNFSIQVSRFGGRPDDPLQLSLLLVCNLIKEGRSVTNKLAAVVFVEADVCVVGLSDHMILALVISDKPRELLNIVISDTVLIFSQDEADRLGSLLNGLPRNFLLFDPDPRCLCSEEADFPRVVENF